MQIGIEWVCYKQQCATSMDLKSSHKRKSAQFGRSKEEGKRKRSAGPCHSFINHLGELIEQMDAWNEMKLGLARADAAAFIPFLAVKGYNWNFAPNGKTILEEACECLSGEKLAMLSAAGADFGQEDDDGKWPLYALSLDAGKLSALVGSIAKLSPEQRLAMAQAAVQSGQDVCLQILLENGLGGELGEQSALEAYAEDEGRYETAELIRAFVCAKELERESAAQERSEPADLCQVRPRERYRDSQENGACKCEIKIKRRFRLEK